MTNGYNSLETILVTNLMGCSVDKKKIQILLLVTILVCSCGRPCVKPDNSIYRKENVNRVTTNPSLPTYGFEIESLMEKQDPKTLPKCIEFVVKIPSAVSEIMYLKNYILYRSFFPDEVLVCYDYLQKKEAWRLVNWDIENIAFDSKSLRAIDSEFIYRIEHNKKNYLINVKTGDILASIDSWYKYEIINNKYLLYTDYPDSFDGWIRLHCQKLGSFKDLWTFNLLKVNKLFNFSVLGNTDDRALVVASAGSPSDGCASYTGWELLVCDLETGKEIKNIPFFAIAGGLAIDENPINMKVSNVLSLHRSYSGVKTNDPLYLYDLDSMKTIWSIVNPSITSILYCSKECFYATDDDTLYKFSMKDGKVIWSLKFPFYIKMIKLGLLNNKCYFMYQQTKQKPFYTEALTENMIVIDDKTGKELSSKTFSKVKDRGKHSKFIQAFEGFQVEADRKNNLTFVVKGKTIARTKEDLNGAVLNNGLLITASDYGITAYDMVGRVKWTSSYYARYIGIIDNMLALVWDNRWIFLNPDNGKFISWFWMEYTHTVKSFNLSFANMLDWIKKEPTGILLESSEYQNAEEHKYPYNFVYSKGEKEITFYRLPKLN